MSTRHSFTHLAPPPAPPMALRWDADGPARLPRDGGGGAVGDGEGSELPLLTSAQMAEFVANGMLVLRLQLPEPWLRDFYDQAQDSPPARATGRRCPSPI